MTKKKNINFPAMLIAGTAAGIISGIVKLGWENLLPPRTSERNKTNPPQKLLEQMGDTFKTLLAILCSVSVMFIIGTTLVIKISNSGMMYR